MIQRRIALYAFRALLLASLLAFVAPVEKAVAFDGAAVCYVVADNTNEGLDSLSRLDGAQEVFIGQTGSTYVEAISFQPGSGVLFGVDSSKFGSLNLTTGAFSFIGGVGSGNGALGSQYFGDIDGLAFEPYSGVLYASVRREAEDLLIQIDPTTGAAVQNAFGYGATYIVIESFNSSHGVLDDVDDIAIDPKDGRLFGIVNKDGTMSRLVAIDKANGAITDITDLDVENIEGLGFSADGTLLGVRGDSDQKVVIINQATGKTTVRAELGTNGSSDYESIACLTDAVNKISGTVFEDTNYDARFDSGDVRFHGATVNLYRDVNGNGKIDATDTLVGSETTDYRGEYLFVISAKGQFLISVNVSTLPDHAQLTTTDLHSATFFTYGQHDRGNDFGFTDYGQKQIDLELTKEVDTSSPKLGDTVTFTITVVNAGPSAATGVLVRDIIPYGLEFEGAWTTQGAYDFMTGFWTIGQLAAGKTAVLDIKAAVAISHTIENIAQVSAANEVDIDSTPDNGDATEDDQDNALVTARTTTAYTPSDCTDMGTITALVYDPVHDLLYAGTETGGVHISNDLGGSWPPFLQTDNRVPIRDIVISKTGVVYVATAGAGVFVTDTQGESWNNVGPADATFQDIDLYDRRVQIYAASRGSVEVWDGMNWSQAGTNSNPFGTKKVTTVAVDDATGLVFAAAPGLGVYVLSNGWWKPMGAGLPVGVINALYAVDGAIYAGTNTDGIYRLESGLWKKFGYGLDDKAIETIATGADGKLLAGTREMGAYYYDASKDLWINAVNLPVYTVSAVTSAPTGEIFAGTPGSGVYAFIDSNMDGELDQWRHVAALVVNAVIQDLVKTETGEIFAATYGYGVLYSNDGGQCWTRMNRGFENLYTYAIERNSAGTLFVGIWADGKGGVWRSDDNARNWQFLDLGNRQVLSLAIDSQDEDIMYAGVNLDWGSVYRSMDGGYTWTQLNSFGDPAWAIQVDPNNSHHVVVGTVGRGVWESYDRAETFTQIQGHYGLPTGAWDLHFGPKYGPYDGQMFAATPQGVYARINGKLELFGEGSEDYDVRTIAFMGDTIFAGTWGRGVLAYNATTGKWVDAGFGDLPVLAFAVHEESQSLIIGTSGSGIFVGHGLAASSGTATATEDEVKDLPVGFSLNAAYPNPFNPRTSIPFELAESAEVRLAIYDLLGREVSVLVDGLVTAGHHQVAFDAGQVPSGTYLVRMSAGSEQRTMTVTLIK
ncbi:MAG: putative repeat protein (TIGR01451 family) [Rhodothermales bacterium]|jgi:uncharacterized repeat protein (TIGR01451 family)